MNPEQFNLHKAAYSVDEALLILSLGRTAFYAAVKRGELKATKIGRKTVVLAPHIVEFLTSLPCLHGGQGGAA